MSIRKKAYKRLNPKTGQMESVKCRNWTIRLRDADGVVRDFPGFRDKGATLQREAQLLKQIELEKSGVRDPFKDHRSRPLKEHLADFEKQLRNQERCDGHIRTTVNQVRKVFELSGAKIVKDVTASKVENALATLRQDGRSISSRNHYLTSAKSFFEWMVRDRRIDANPIKCLRKANVAVDRRRVRRALPMIELQTLIRTTLGEKSYETLSGTQRAVAYLFAAYTGLRRNEIGSLTRSSFKLQANPPQVLVKAAHSKHRKADVIVLPQHVAQIVGNYLEGCPAGQDEPVLPIAGRRTSEMLARDLKAAGIDVGVAETGIVDFHSLRVTFITRLAESGVLPKVTQELARHSDINLTMNTYTKIEVDARRSAVESLPKVQCEIPVAELQPLHWPLGLGNLGQFEAVPVTEAWDEEAAQFCEDQTVSLGKTLETDDPEIKMRETGVEPARVAPLDPKSSASASSATLAGAASTLK
jgi:integrase